MVGGKQTHWRNDSMSVEQFRDNGTGPRDLAATKLIHLPPRLSTVLERRHDDIEEPGGLPV
jgi:hypothetical protein